MYPINHFRTIEELTKALSKDLDGRPAILHPLSVGMARTNDEEMICTTTSPGAGPVGKRKQVKKHTEALELIRQLTGLDC